MHSRFLFWSLFGLFGAILTSCGAAPPRPVAPREARFTVNALQGTEFDAVEIRSQNAIHRPCPLQGAHFQAPYQFILENAVAPVQGTFAPADPSSPIDNVQLIFGGDTVPRVVQDPTADTPVFSGTAPQPIDTSVPACGTISTSGAHEVRFDLSGTPGVQFSATLGDQVSSHLVGVTVSAPATFYLENAVVRVTGVFTKFGVVGQLTAQLLIDGRLVATSTSPDGFHNDLVLQYQF